MNNEPKELKLCAHCGRVPQKYDGGDYVVNHESGCIIAALKGSCNHWISGSKAIKAWQTRATPDVSEIVEALKLIQLNYNAVDCQRIASAALAKATKIGGVE